MVRTPVVVAVLLAGALAALIAQGTGERTGRRAAPPLPVHVLVPPRPTLASLHGRPAIVHFWASWCEPCIKEAPELARLSSRLDGRATLVGVNWSDGRANAMAFIRRHRWRFPIVEDTGDTAGENYRLNGLPSTFIIDGEGRIIKQLIGPQTAAGLLAELPA